MTHNLLALRLGTALLLGVANAAWAQTAPASRASEARLPAFQMVASFNADTLLTQLKRQPLFAEASTERYGSPLALRVTHAFLPTTAGKAGGFVSVMLSATSLGLLPVYDNKDLVITYDLFVNGMLLMSRDYRRNFSRAVSIYADDDSQGFGDDGMAWALQTTAQFAADALQEPKIAAVLQEHRLYFGAATPTP